MLENYSPAPLGHRNPKFRLDLLAFEGIQSQMTFVTQAGNLFFRSVFNSNADEAD